MRVTWTSPWDFALSLDWRHVGSVDLDFQEVKQASGAPGQDQHTPAFDYFDLSGTWTLHTGIELRAGVDNVLDKSPPIYDSNSFGVSAPAFGNGNTYPGVYDSLGRTVFIGVTAKY
jgi:outer membrane receptor protein involved in Fe transport